jgi:hypothetical protein
MCCGETFPRVQGVEGLILVGTLFPPIISLCRMLADFFTQILASCLVSSGIKTPQIHHILN